MNEIEVTFNRKKYYLTDKNNNNKYTRAVAMTREKLDREPKPSEVLPYYDKLGGYIHDEDGRKVANSTFWEKEKKRLEKKEHRSKVIDSLWKISSHPVLATLIVISIVFAVFKLLGVNLANFAP